ncbi:MAG: GAF domain-containing protein, partial [Candidatus Heimdallarchaeota archaeon]|nr:GAF domain-containing protein [Candidatus Heimdallarchaeota archaeon]
MPDENRGFVFCLENLDEVLKHEKYIEKLGYKLVRIKHFEDVINAQSNAIMHGEIDVPVIFFINSSVFLKAWDNDQVRLRHLKRKYIGVVLVLEDDIQLADRMHEVLIDDLEIPATPARIKRLLRNAEKRMLLEIEKAKLRSEIGLRVMQMKEMQQIGISLSIERNIRKLLGNILEKARELTNSDAGSIYLVDRNDPNKLRFVKAQNDSVDVPFEETEMELNKASIAGCCVVSGKLININDAYNISENAPFTHNQEWDESIGYRTKIILSVPMSINSGETIGCIQLINRKKNKNEILEDPIADIENRVTSFNSENKSMISSFASQAAVAINNSYLLEDIENLIEGLVRASVVAIESRDPATSGHSSRVAELSMH